MMNRRAWLMVPGCLFALACADGGATAPPDGSLDLSGGQRVEVRALTDLPVHSSGMGERARDVVRTEAEWRAAWSRIWGNHVPQPSIPAVDFGREAVLVAAMGTRNTGGYTITVDSAVATPGALHVFVTERSPRGCVTTQALTAPVHVVAVPVDGRAVQFHETQALQDCGS